MREVLWLDMSSTLRPFLVATVTPFANTWLTISPFGQCPHSFPWESRYIWPAACWDSSSRFEHSNMSGSDILQDELSTGQVAWNNSAFVLSTKQSVQCIKCSMYKVPLWQLVITTYYTLPWQTCSHKHHFNCGSCCVKVVRPYDSITFLGSQLYIEWTETKWNEIAHVSKRH